MGVHMKRKFQFYLKICHRASQADLNDICNSQIEHYSLFQWN